MNQQGKLCQHYMKVRVVVTWRIKLVLEPIDIKNSKLDNFVSRPRNLLSKMFDSVSVPIISLSRVLKIHENTLILESDNIEFQENVFQESLQMTSCLLKERNLPNPDETRRKVIKLSLINNRNEPDKNLPL